MKVCVGITTKNRGKILPKALESALSQSYPNIQVLVFDDGSTDETLSLPQKYPMVQWIREDKSIGLQEARNKMMRSCDADLFVSLDDDSWFLQNDEIEIAVNEMKNAPKLAALSFDVLQKNTKRFKPVERLKRINTNVFIGCGHVLRLSAVKEVGYYVPFPLKYGHEEKDLCLRLIDAGYEIIFLEGVHVWHDYTSIERDLREQRRSFIVNDLVFPYRRVPLPFLFPVLINNIYRKLKSKENDKKLTRKAIWEFFTLLASQSEYVSRVKPSSYRKYRALSKSFLSYLSANDQNNPQIE